MLGNWSLEKLFSLATMLKYVFQWQILVDIVDSCNVSKDQDNS